MTEISLSTPAARSFKLPARAMPIVFAFFMSAIMAFLMCGVIVAANSGFPADYFARVIRAYIVAMPAAFVCVLIVRPVALKLASLFVCMPGK